MKLYVAGLAALAILAPGAAAFAQTDMPEGTTSKTVVHHEDGSKTMIKKDAMGTKKVHTAANGDKKIVKKSADGDTTVIKKTTE
jgi:hypothetical protein